MVNPYNAAGAAAGAGVGGLLGRALNALDYPRQALWNIPDKIAQGDYAAAVPGLLGVGAGIGTAALGGGLPLAFLAGSLAGGAGQAVGSSVDEGRFQAPTAQDLTGSDDWLLNTLTSMAGDPLTYAGGVGGRAGANALRPKSVLEKYPATGFYGELPDASQPLVSLVHPAPKVVPPDLPPLGAAHEYTFAPPAGGASEMSLDDALRQRLNMLHDLAVEHQAGMVPTPQVVSAQRELWDDVMRMTRSLPPESSQSFWNQMDRVVRGQGAMSELLGSLGRDAGAPRRNPLVSGTFPWADVGMGTNAAAPKFIDQSMANLIREHQLRLGDEVNRVRGLFGNLENDVYERYLREAEDAARNQGGPRMTRGDLPAMDELLKALRDLGIPSSRRRLRDTMVNNLLERYPPAGGYELDLGDLA